MNVAALAVFIIGLRHGADPDHLAAVDNLTRNASERMPRASRFTGTFFALGHSAMVIACAAAAALLGARITHGGEAFERAGAIASIALLLLMAGLNIATLARGRASLTVRHALLPPVLRNATHPLAALPIGALFGLGFETSTQLAAYGAAFSNGHLMGGLLIGLVFCLGMICTDTVDSLLVARVVATDRADAMRARRAWIAVVTLVALAVAADEITVFLGFTPPLDEVTLSAITVALLGVTALVVAVQERTRARRVSIS